MDRGEWVSGGRMSTVSISPFYFLSSPLYSLREWVGWRSNPCLQVFSLALHHLSYRPKPTYLLSSPMKLHEKSPMSL